MFYGKELEVVTVPGHGKPKVYRAKVQVDRKLCEISHDWQKILAFAAEQAKDTIRQNIGTAIGEYTVKTAEDPYHYGQILIVTATWTSRCRSIKPPKPPLTPEDVLGE